MLNFSKNVAFINEISTKWEILSYLLKDETFDSITLEMANAMLDDNRDSSFLCHAMF